MADALAYVAAALVALWGVAHLIPTSQVVAGFGAISLDSRRVLTMEWVAEGIAMIFVGVLVAVAAAVVGDADPVYRVAAGFLAAVAVLTALTGARTPVLWFRACPVLLSVVIALLLGASFA